MLKIPQSPALVAQIRQADWIVSLKATSDPDGLRRSIPRLPDAQSRKILSGCPAYCSLSAVATGIITSVFTQTQSIQICFTIPPFLSLHERL